MRRLSVRIISRKVIKDASARHREWAASLSAWYKIAKAADWNRLEEVRAGWKNSDQAGKFVTFDISRNQCRLICTIQYDRKMVYIRDVLSHSG
jgi:mRNA interferase HigB